MDNGEIWDESRKSILGLLTKPNFSASALSQRRTFSRWERRDAYVWITDLQNDIVGSKGVQPQAAWRIAVEAWLNMKGFITITIKGKVLPGFL